MRFPLSFMFLATPRFFCRNRQKALLAVLSLALFYLSATSAIVHSKPITLIDDGNTLLEIYATPAARPAAEWFAQTAAARTSATLTIHEVSSLGEASASVPRLVLVTQEELSTLKPAVTAPLPQDEGFTVTPLKEAPGHIIVGADAVSLRYALGELWNYHIALAGKTATLPADLKLEMHPTYPMRILWNWNFMTNWHEDLHKVHDTRGIDPGGTQQPYLDQPSGYIDHFTRVIDYAAEHKLNGLIIWGFLNDAHGGVEAGQKLSKYAKDRGVRILPGVGTVIYGGFYHSGSTTHSLNTWLAQNPDVTRMLDKKGNKVEAPSPSDPRTMAYLSETARWFFKTFPDIGGVNFEHGDFFEDQQPASVAERAKPENDHNFLWDMMATQVPLFEIAEQIHPGLWLTFSPYWGYNKDMMKQPPKFLGQYPEQAIVQWTYSGMAAEPQNWPSDLKPPSDHLRQIGLLHQGSYWSSPSQWWASPGDTYGLVVDVIQRACARAIEDNSKGLEIVGQIGPVSPQNELNYLAFEEFTWNPEQSVAGWIDERLAPLVGGKQLAQEFYKLTADTTTDTQVLQQQLDRTIAVQAELKDPRQLKRWKNLEGELTRRKALAAAGRTKPFGPGALEGVEEFKLEF